MIVLGRFGAAPAGLRWTFGAFLFSFLTLAGVYAIVTLKQHQEGVLGDYSEAAILSEVAGSEGPAVLVGGTLSVGQDRCIRGGAAITVDETIYFRPIAPEGQPVPFLSNAKQPRLPDCNFSIFQVPLPAKVTPGTWRLEGISRSVSTSEVRYWASEPFQVIEQR